MTSPLPLLLASFVAAAALSAPAAPLKRADLSANPAWVLHIDCDALRQTYLGKYLLYQMDKPEMNSNMVSFQSIFSFDLRTQLHGVTVYSEGPTPKANLVIIYADFDPDHLVTLFKGYDAAEIFTNRQHVIYSWIDKKNNPHDADGPRKYTALQDGRMIVGQDKEGVSAALAVIDGTAPNLSAGKGLPELAVGGGATFLQVAACNMDFLDSNASTALIRMSKRAKLQASEVDEQLNAALTLEVGAESTAQQMSLVVQGLIAMLNLQRDNPQMAKLAGGLSVKQAGATLTATLSMPSADLIAVIKEAIAKKEQKRAAKE